MFGVHMCHHARVELRGWHAGLSSFCSLFGPGDQAQVIRFGDTGHQRNFCRIAESGCSIAYCPAQLLRDRGSAGAL